MSQDPSGGRPIPLPDAWTQPYWDAAREHRLVIQRCRGCEAYQHPPLRQCDACGAAELDWTPISGRGEVYSYIIDRRLLIPSFDEAYVVAQINPIEAEDDSVRITANIVECELDAVEIGMPVEVVFEDLDERTSLPQFRPSGSPRQSSD